MVHAYHVVLSTYGFWLPNDPRGSWSDFVGSWELAQYGKATKVSVRRSQAAMRHDARIRRAAKAALKRPAAILNGRQARAAGRGFANECARNEISIWALAILPEHCHLVIGRHPIRIERIANLLKGSATRELIAEAIHPFETRRSTDGKLPKVWSRGCWKVYLNTTAQIQTAIRYVERNPLKEGKRKQVWSTVRPFDASTLR
jgi:REP element-mobilizing transposase RayT